MGTAAPAAHAGIRAAQTRLGAAAPAAGGIGGNPILAGSGAEVALSASRLVGWWGVVEDVRRARVYNKERVIDHECH